MPTRPPSWSGAGHCGLAMSRCLAERSIDHVVLERGEVANSWRTQRWDSLRLLTPNWMTRLPGYAYRGDDPDGYLARPRWSRLHRGLRRRVGGAGADRHHGHVGAAGRGRATWCGPTRAAGTRATRRGRRPARPRPSPVPALAERLPAGITTVTARGLPQPRPAARRRGAGRRRLGERRPDRRGAAALRAAGHARRRRARADAAHLPGPRHPLVDGRRRACSTSATTRSPDLVRARNLPSMQLVGSPQRATLDLNALRRAGGAAGRPARRHPGRDGAVLRLAARTCARWPTSSWAGCWTPSTPGPTEPGVGRLGAAATVRADRGARARAAVGAASAPARSRRSSGPPGSARTCRGSTSPVFDRKGRVAHDGGVTASPGLYLSACRSCAAASRR